MNPTLPVPTRPPSAATAPMPGGHGEPDPFSEGDADREWQAFLALGQRVDASSLGGDLRWRHPPLLLSF